MGREQTWGWEWPWEVQRLPLDLAEIFSSSRSDKTLKMEPGLTSAASESQHSWSEWLYHAPCILSKSIKNNIIIL